MESKLTITGSKFSSNRAAADGGGLRAEGAAANRVDLSISGSTFASNLAGYGGGGMTANGDGLASISASKFVGNSSFIGGGIFVSDSGITKRVCHAELNNNQQYRYVWCRLGDLSRTADFHISGGSITNNSGVLGAGIRARPLFRKHQGGVDLRKRGHRRGGRCFSIRRNGRRAGRERVQGNTAQTNPDFDSTFTFI